MNRGPIHELVTVEGQRYWRVNGRTFSARADAEQEAFLPGSVAARGNGETITEVATRRGAAFVYAGIRYPSMNAATRARDEAQSALERAPHEWHRFFCWEQAVTASKAAPGLAMKCEVGSAHHNSPAFLVNGKPYPDYPAAQEAAERVKGQMLNTRAETPAYSYSKDGLWKPTKTPGKAMLRVAQALATIDSQIEEARHSLSNFDRKHESFAIEIMSELVERLQEVRAILSVDAIDHEFLRAFYAEEAVAANEQETNLRLADMENVMSEARAEAARKDRAWRHQITQLEERHAADIADIHADYARKEQERIAREKGELTRVGKRIIQI